MNTSEPKRARRRWPVVVLVLVLVVLSIVLVLPGQLAPWVVRRALVAFDEERAGELVVDDVEIGWFSATTITGARLLDPEGVEVARADVRGPSLWNIAKGMGRELGTLHVEGSAALVADESGTTNFARALASRTAAREPEDAPTSGGGASGELPRVRLEVLLREVTWTDPRQPEVLGVRDFAGHVETNGDVSFALDGDVIGAEGGRLHLAGEIERPLAPLDSSAPPAFRVRGDVRSLATGLVDALAGADGLLLAQAGATFDLTLEGEGTTRAGSLDARLTSEGLEAELSLALEDGVVRERDGVPALRAELRRLTSAVERFAEHLPEGATLEFVGEAATIVVERLRAPLAALEAETPAALVELTLSARLPQLSYLHPTPNAGAKRIDVADVELDVEVAPEAPARLALRAAIGSEPRGSLAVDATHPDPLGTPEAPARFEARLVQFSTALVDALAQRDGLLVDVLGPRIDGRVTGQWPTGDVPVTAHFESASGTFDVAAFVENGVLRAEDVGALNANVALSPLFSERIVGNLVPHLVQVRKEKADERVGLAVTNFQLPLDGNFEQLSADVTLDLGAVRYEFLPGLDQVLQLAGVGDLERSKVFEPLRMRIQNGLVRYERLPLSIEGKDYPFAGSFDLAGRAFDLEAELPLSLLGASVLKDLGRATSVLSGDTLVPIQLEGTISRPKLSVPSDFAKKLLERTGEDLLRRGIRDLFGGK